MTRQVDRPDISAPDWHARSFEDVARDLRTHPETGLAIEDFSARFPIDDAGVLGLSTDLANPLDPAQRERDPRPARFQRRIPAPRTHQRRPGDPRVGPLFGRIRVRHRLARREGARSPAIPFGADRSRCSKRARARDPNLRCPTRRSLDSLRRANRRCRRTAGRRERPADRRVGPHRRERPSHEDAGAGGERLPTARPHQHGLRRHDRLERLGQTDRDRGAGRN